VDAVTLHSFNGSLSGGENLQYMGSVDLDGDGVADGVILQSSARYSWTKPIYKTFVVTNAQEGVDFLPGTSVPNLREDFQLRDIEELYDAPPPDPSPSPEPTPDPIPEHPSEWIEGRNLLEGTHWDDVLIGDELALDRDVFAGQAYRLYQATLDREPDQAGHEAWTNTISSGEITLKQAVSGFVNSAEFQAKYGATDNAQFVTLLYNNVLDRDPDAGGYSTWTNALNAGMAREDVVLGFSESAEFVQKTATGALAFSSAVYQQSFSDDVYRLYQAMLDRNPDADGLDSWTEALVSGMSKQQAVSGFVNSAEFQSKYGATDNSQFVELLYRNVLDRNPDAGGLETWTNALNAGMSREDVVLGFADSAEFIANTTSSLKDFMQSEGAKDLSDVLVGGHGDDVLIGGIGSDVFVFNAQDSGNDVVIGLEDWDLIRLEGFGYSNIGEVEQNLTQHGEDVVFADGNQTVTFLDTQISDLIFEDQFVIA
jgi:hypothetical protein